MASKLCRTSDGRELYDSGMTVTISEFGKSLFQLVEKARNVERIEFTHLGEVFCVVPQGSL